MKIEQVRKIMRRIIEDILLRKRAKEATAKSAEKGIGVSSQPKTGENVGTHGNEIGLKRKASGMSKNAFDGKAERREGKGKAEKGGKDGK